VAGLRSSSIGSGAKRALPFQPAAAAAATAPAAGGSSPREQLKGHTSYSIHAGGGGSSPTRHPWLAPGNGTEFNPSAGSFRTAAAAAPSLGTATGYSPAASPPTAAADRYEELVREADAALQQLAACQRVADSAAPFAAAAAAGSSPVRAAALRSYNPLGANHTGSRPASARAAAGGHYSSYEGLARIASKAGNSNPVGRSPGSLSRHLTTSAAAAAGRQPGSYDSFGGKSSWSPQRVRPGSAEPLGTSPSAAAAAIGSAGHVSHMLKGELQALDSDIEAAEASLKAAAQRLGAASTLPSRW
jgi:hypothetical protein